MLDVCAERATPGWFAGAVVRDEPRAPFDARALASECESIARRGGVPVIFPSFGLGALDDRAWLAAHRALSEHADTFVAFELSTDFHPAGRIVNLDVYAGLLEIQACVGAKHFVTRARARVGTARAGATNIDPGSACSQAMISPSTW